MLYAGISLINRIISWCSESNIHHFITKMFQKKNHFITKCNKGRMQPSCLEGYKIYTYQILSFTITNYKQTCSSNKLIKLYLSHSQILFSISSKYNKVKTLKQPKALQPPFVQGYKR